MKRPYIPLGIQQQGRLTPTALDALRHDFEPWHLPHMACHLTERHLDGKQAERDTAAMPLPELLLAKGSMTGPHRRTTPITRWRLLGRQVAQEIAALCRITTLKD